VVVARVAVVILIIATELPLAFSIPLLFFFLLILAAVIQLLGAGTSKTGGQDLGTSAEARARTALAVSRLAISGLALMAVVLDEPDGGGRT
jgi:hypothetical protein